MQSRKYKKKKKDFQPDRVDVFLKPPGRQETTFYIVALPVVAAVGAVVAVAPNPPSVSPGLAVAVAPRPPPREKPGVAASDENVANI